MSVLRQRCALYVERVYVIVIIYCISGLGVDERVFRNLNSEELELRHIPWIEPLPSESLEDYSKRLFGTAELPEEYNLMGLSFGGMIAQEFEKIRKPKNLFLISTCSGYDQLPVLIKMCKYLRLNKIVPKKFLNKYNSLIRYYFGANTPGVKSTLKEILKDTDPKFLKWAINALLHWKNQFSTAGVRIHGDNDKLIPAQKDTVLISNAGHLMILSHPDELVNTILTKVK